MNLFQELADFKTQKTKEIKQSALLLANSSSVSDKSSNEDTEDIINDDFNKLINSEYKFTSDVEYNSKIPNDDHRIRLKQRGYEINSMNAIEKGTFSQIFAITEQSTKIKCVVKVFQYKELAQSDGLYREFTKEMIKIIKIFKSQNMNHHLIQYYRHFMYDKKDIYIIMEQSTGDNLQTRLNKCKDKGFTESQTWKYFKQIAEAINYLHTQSIAHRNLKLDNVLVFKAKDGQEVLKVSDYSTNRMYRKTAKTVVYKRDAKSVIYMSPQILIFYTKHLEQKYKKSDIKDINPFDPMKGDIWALGICLYCMLIKSPPYGIPPKTNGLTKQDAVKEKSKFVKDCLNQIKSDLLIPKQVEWKFSYNCRDLLNEMLDKNVQKRINHFGVIKHQWTQKGDQIITNKTKK
ncbi:testis-specific serine/threonine-protein kinase 4-like [Oppia nitens]|uniref:testis-specific serine/threonine-protein kinase 4-like n=1 Tax=Oppia nitens TaxID=1686743 RepID=UPI0023DC337E|nr:testis-specific serine/threonine-protein kinase 4-like [Oppia nitens]